MKKKETQVDLQDAELDSVIAGAGAIIEDDVIDFRTDSPDPEAALTAKAGAIVIIDVDIL